MHDQEILNYVKGNATAEEQQQLEAWIQASDENTIYFNRLKAFYIATTFDTSINELEIDQALANYLAKIDTKPTVQKKTKHLYWWAATAASIALLISFAMKYSTNDQAPQQPATMVKSDIEIGTDKATLTLEDGSTIPLAHGTQYSATNATSNGEQLIYTSAGDEAKDELMYNTLTIPRGGQFYVKLIDGTEVWLNSESKLKYPTAFTKGETRRVELLYGEAYFEVSPSSIHNGDAFEVISRDQSINVLGTEFNVKAYREESSTYTTLVGGEVAIKTAGQDQQLLQPNEQAVVREGRFIRVENVDVEDIISWKDGQFAFKNLPLNEIMTVLSRWYDVSVVFENEDLKHIEFNGKLRKNLSIEEIMNTIKRTNNIDYKISDKSVIFM